MYTHLLLLSGQAHGVSAASPEWQTELYQTLTEVLCIE